MKLTIKAFVSLAFLISSPLFASGDPVDYQFSPATPIRADEINSNFQELADRIQLIDTSDTSTSTSTTNNTTNYCYDCALSLKLTDPINPFVSRAEINSMCRIIDPKLRFCNESSIEQALMYGSYHLITESGFTGGWVDSRGVESRYIDGSHVKFSVLQDYMGNCNGWSVEGEETRAASEFKGKFFTDKWFIKEKSCFSPNSSAYTETTQASYIKNSPVSMVPAICCKKTSLLAN